MTSKHIVKDEDFKEVAQVRVDAKFRIVLGKVSKGIPQFRIYQNALGQIILDPQTTIPAYEAWLFKDTQILKSLQRSLAQVKAGKTVKAREDYSKYLD